MKDQSSWTEGMIAASVPAEPCQQGNNVTREAPRVRCSVERFLNNTPTFTRDQQIKIIELYLEGYRVVDIAGALSISMASLGHYLTGARKRGLWRVQRVGWDRKHGEERRQLLNSAAASLSANIRRRILRMLRDGFAPSTVSRDTKISIKLIHAIAGMDDYAVVKEVRETLAQPAPSKRAEKPASFEPAVPACQELSAERKAELEARKERRCLRCNKQFLSWGAGNRICSAHPAAEDDLGEGFKIVGVR